jgi:hypothetical protein
MYLGDHRVGEELRTFATRHGERSAAYKHVTIADAVAMETVREKATE